MKTLKISTVLMLAIITLVGCKRKTTATAPQSVDEELVFRVLKLRYQAEELCMQVGWLRANLEKCLAELEAERGLEPIKFDWSEAMGFPKVKGGPNLPEQRVTEPKPFYIPYRGIKMPELETEKYTDMEMLSATIGLTNRTLDNNMLGMDEYIEHLEERLKRLEEYLEK